MPALAVGGSRRVLSSTPSLGRLRGQRQRMARIGARLGQSRRTPGPACHASLLLPGTGHCGGPWEESRASTGCSLDLPGCCGLERAFAAPSALL